MRGLDNSWSSCENSVILNLRKVVNGGATLARTPLVELVWASEPVEPRYASIPCKSRYEPSKPLLLANGMANKSEWSKIYFPRSREGRV